MNLQGNIKVTLEHINFRVDKVYIDNNREKNASQLLNELQPLQAVPLLGKIFTLCAGAQSLAGQFALNQLNVDVACPDMRLSQQRLTMEWLKDHNWQLFLLLNKLNLISTKNSPIINIHQQLNKFEQQCSVGSNLTEKNCLSKQQLLLLKQQFGLLIGCSVDEFYQLDWDGFCQWRQSNSAPYAMLFNAIWQLNWHNLGVNVLSGTIRQPYTDVMTEMFNKVNQIEQGSFARCQQHGLICQSIQIIGPGLISRILARVVEICAVLLAKGTAEPILVHRVNEQRALALVAASRGYLLHDVSVINQYIDSYRIHAPTDTVFGQNSQVSRALENLTAQEPSELQRKAEFLVASFDPCVDYKVELLNA